jgi:hypothetical protein
MDGNSDSVKKNRSMVSSSYNYNNNHEFRAILGVSIQTFRSSKIWGDFFGPQRSRCVGSTQFRAGQFYFVSIAGGLLSSAYSIASAATLITQHEISPTTGVNGIILSSLTSILINVPLIRSMIKEAAFRKRVCLGLALVAVVGLVGVGLDEMISVFAPRFLAGGLPVRSA